MLRALEEIKPNETELEFLDLMGINLRKGEFLDENNDKFVYESSRSSPGKRDGIWYEFKCGNTELSFFRDMDENEELPYNYVRVIKNGKVYEAGEIPNEYYPLRWVEFGGDVSVRIDSLPHVHCSPEGAFYSARFAIDSNFFSIHCLPSGIVRINGYSKPSKVALSDEGFGSQYVHGVNAHLKHNQDAKKFVDLVYPFIFNDYKRSLNIPIISHKDFRHYWQFRELQVRTKFGNEVADAMARSDDKSLREIIKEALDRQNGELSEIIAESKAINSYVTNCNIDPEIVREAFRHK